MWCCRFDALRQDILKWKLNFDNSFSLILVDSMVGIITKVAPRGIGMAKVRLS